MKILQIYKDYYPPVKGGIEGHINALANGLKARGIEVEVLVSNTRPRLDQENIDGIRVTKVPQVGRFASASLNMTFSHWIQKLGMDADILHFHFPNPTAEISYLISGLKKPVVVTYHSDIIRQARLLKIYTPFLKKFLNQAQRIIVTSPNYLESSPFLKEFRHRCRLVPFGIDLSEFTGRPSQTIRKLRGINGFPIILFVGRFRYYKGLHVLIEAMNQVDGKLFLIGGGPLERELKAQVDGLGLSERVVFLGELPDAAKIDWLHACDLFVLPSVFRSEAFGIVQLEAMACAKPVVCTELDTGTTYVNRHNQTGLVVPPSDPAALAGAIQYLLDHPEKRSNFGDAGRTRVQNLFSQDKMIEEVLSVYREVLIQPAIPVKTTIGRALPTEAVSRGKIKILRIISRLNIGGPAIHAFLLTSGLDRDRFETLLVTGQKSRYEGDMSYLFDSVKNQPIFIRELQRELNIVKDIKAFLRILRIIYRETPDIVHTHTTKAGASARFAVFLYKVFHRKDIRTIHTFHGHVFSGYFSPTISLIIIWIERFLMKLTDLVIAISGSQKQELTQKYCIAPSYKVVTNELGFDLTPFIENMGKRGQFRKKLGMGESTTLIGIIGRLVPIKNHKMFLNAARYFIDDYPDKDVKFIIIGDGELHTSLEKYSRELRLEKCILFYGWARDVSIVYSDLDILALTSLNEGTPVSVIEAMASGVPVISTDAGGVVDLVGAERRDSRSNGFRICERGILCGKDDSVGFAKGLRYVMDMDPSEKEAMLNRAKKFVRERYTQERLIQNMEKLYIDLMRNGA